MTTKKIPGLDSKAAPCTNQDDALREAMRNLRPPRSRPTQAASAVAKHAGKKSKRAKAKGVNPVVLENETPKFNLKGELTIMELKFIELYLLGGLTIENAMKAAGYINYHPKYRYAAAKKIIEKYECNVGDHRKIMRAMGHGETKIIELLINSAENAMSETVRLNARIALAKCLGLYREGVDEVQGLKIIIDFHDGD